MKKNMNTTNIRIVRFFSRLLYYLEEVELIHTIHFFSTQILHHCMHVTCSLVKHVHEYLFSLLHGLLHFAIQVGISKVLSWNVLTVSFLNKNYLIWTTTYCFFSDFLCDCLVNFLSNFSVIMGTLRLLHLYLDKD